MQSRLFWRRLFAFSVDYLLVYGLTLLVLLPFLNPAEGKLRLANAPLSFTQCHPLTTLPQVYHDLIAPAPIDSATACKKRPFGLDNGLTVTLIYNLVETQTNNVTTRSYSSLSVAATEAGTPFIPVQPQSALIWITLIVASASFLTKGQPSPGKRLLGLQIAGQGCPMCREARRLGPCLLLGMTSLLVPLFLQVEDLTTLSGNLSLIILIAVPLLLFLFFYYLLPLLRWRGAMPWDRATGFHVARRP